MHGRLRNADTCVVAPSVQPCLHLQSLGGGRRADEVHHRLVVLQWAASPIHADMTEETVLHLVPLARPRREVTDADGQTRRVRQSLQLGLLHATPRAVAAPESAVTSSCFASG